ncbi:MAG: hypothetical protein ACHREM_14615, partial [Polyangiales bacterium]
MPKLLVGCAQARGAMENVAKKFDLVELALFDKPTTTKAPALRRWRREAGPTTAFALVAPKIVSAVRPGDPLDKGVEELLEAQRAIEAQWLVLTTPIEVTPSPLQRERLKKLVDQIRAGLGEAKSVVRIAWEPKGVWEGDVAGSFAKSLGLDLSVDPLADAREPFWHPTLRYLRQRPTAGRDGVAPTRLRNIAELLAGAMSDDDEDSSFVTVFLTAHAAAEGKKLKSLVKAIVE